MLTLVHAPMSRSTMTRWVLDELGADYQLREVSIMRRGGSGERDPNNPHPHKQVPALIDGETVVWEQIAIAIYLAELFPHSPLVRSSGHAQHGAFLSWLVWYAATLEPAVQGKMEGVLDDHFMLNRSHGMAFELLIKQLSEHPYLLGNEPTLPDFFVAGALDFARSAGPASEVLDAFLARMRNRPVYQSLMGGAA